MRWVPAVFAVVLASTAHAAPEPDSEEQFVIEAKALLADPAERPCHVSPALEATFGELAEPHLAALLASYKRVGTETEEQMRVRKEVFDGKRALADLPPVWNAELQRMAPDLDGLLRATHARTGQLPESLGLVAVLPTKDDRLKAIAVQHAAKLASLRMLHDIEKARPYAALAICADTLALARDTSHAFLIGQMVAVAVTGIVNGPCLRALNAASAEAQTTFASQVETISRGWTSFGTTLQQEKVFGELVGFDRLSSSTQAALPAELHYASIEAPPGFMLSVRRGLFAGWSRRTRVRAMDKLIAAADLSPAQVDAAMDSFGNDIGTAAMLASDPDADGTTNWTKFAQRARIGRARLVLLRAAALIELFHAQNHRWPKTRAEAGLDPLLDPRSGLPVQILATPTGVQLEPQGDWPRTEDDLSVEMH